MTDLPLVADDYTNVEPSTVRLYEQEICRSGNLGLYLRTARHLKAKQIFYNLLRRGWSPKPRPRKEECPGLRGTTLDVRPIGRSLYDPSKKTLTFLNDAQVLNPSNTDWSGTGQSELWVYNLHYFDWLMDENLASSLKCTLIDQWITGNRHGRGVGWEPYPTSLRIVNWIKFFVGRTGNLSLREGWAESLFEQASWLERNIEHHLLANHLFKNCVALAFAGAFFAGPEAERWLKKAWLMLRVELAEQILSDGGHFERSPLYHSIIVEDLLDLLNLAQSNPKVFRAEKIVALSEKADAALDFLDNMTYPDGQIALFNDAAFNVAPPPDHLFSYAEAVLGIAYRTRDQDTELIHKPQSGYFGVTRNQDKLVIDCGPLGPDYQPGHGHCDALSFELVLNGRRVVVDSGVHDYEVGDLRQYFRSTAAHNTIRIDGIDQSEIWAAHRVGARAKSSLAGARLEASGDFLFRGGHNGYKRLEGGVTHTREIRFSAASVLGVNDKIVGRGFHKVESFLHFHPDFALVRTYGGAEILEKTGALIARLVTPANCEVTFVDGAYSPEFGKIFVNPVVVMSTRTELPVELSYRIEAA